MLLDKQVENQLAHILADIKIRRHWISPVTDRDRAAHQEFLDRMSQMPPDTWQHLLRMTESCVGCGICEKVCPSGSIHMVNGKAGHTPDIVKRVWPVSSLPPQSHSADGPGEEPPRPATAMSTSLWRKSFRPISKIYLIKMSQLESKVETAPQVLRQVADTCNIIQVQSRELSRDDIYEILCECL